VARSTNNGNGDAGGRGRDTIFVSGIEFEASHGYTAAERKLTRRFRCDIELHTDLTASSRSDRIQDTLDYRKVCQIAVDIGTQRTFRLLEALAGAIADEVQERWPDVGLTITVQKFSPPCPGAPEATGVRLARSPRSR
jgi:dihydroneopterin aldolase